MGHGAVSDWQELSKLYEEADGLDASGCEALLARLRETGHPLVSRLEDMLRARDRVRTGDFLDRLPSLPSLAPPRPGEGSVSPGDHFGPYSLVRRLGSGGMAQVWLAERDDGAFQRHVAIKLPYRHAEGAQRENLAQRFARERDILAALHHPNIAALHDAGVTPAGQPWLALEMVEGEAITDWCDRQRLPVRERVRLFRQVLRAVQHAHANLVIHRDLKPANILVTPQGNVRLLDFGIAKLIEPVDGRNGDSELTREGGTPLTLQYASPEQVAGTPLTTACDVYSLGVVLYELLAGVRPYELKVQSAAQVEQAILEQEPRAPSRREATAEVLAARCIDAKGLHRQLAPDLDAVVLRALAKSPSVRYASAEALLADLDRWLAGQPVTARRPSAWYWLRKFTARHRIAVALGAASLASLIGATTLAVLMSIQARQESARAVAARDFLLDMFRQVDPQHSGGRDISARELLHTGQAKALKDLGNQPQLQAELLGGLSEVQVFLSDYVRADEAMRQVELIQRREGNPRAVSLAQLERADIAMRMGDNERSRRLMADAERTAPGHRDDPEWQFKRSFVLGWLGLQVGESNGQRMAMAEQALRHAERAYGAFARQTIDALRLRSDVHFRGRDHERAIADLAEAERRMAGRPTFTALDRINIRMDRDAIDFAAGNFAHAAEAFEATLQECVLQLGSANEECGTLRVKRAIALLLVGDVASAKQMMPLVLDQARQTASPRRQAEALVMAYRIASASHDAAVELRLRPDVERLGESGDEVPQYGALKVSALMALGEDRLRNRDSELAMKWLAKAVDRAAAPSIDRRTQGRAALLEGIALQMAGQHVQALVQFDRAQKAYAESAGRDSPFTLLFSLNRCHSLEALGRGDEARLLSEKALPVLRRALGNSPLAAELERWTRRNVSDPALFFL